MKALSLVALGLAALWPLGCEKGKFAAQNGTSDTYAVKVIEEPGAAATRSAAATAEEDSAKGKAAGSRSSNPDEDDDSREDQTACASAAGLDANRVHVSGAAKDVTLSADSAYALKISGSQNLVTLKLAGESPATRLSTLCLFVSGDQNHLILEIGMKVGQVFIKARGNQALIEGKVSKEGMIENIRLDAKGHEPTITLEGDGQFPSL